MKIVISDTPPYFLDASTLPAQEHTGDDGLPRNSHVTADRDADGVCITAVARQTGETFMAIEGRTSATPCGVAGSSQPAGDRWRPCRPVAAPTWREWEPPLLHSRVCLPITA